MKFCLIFVAIFVCFAAAGETYVGAVVEFLPVDYDTKVIEAVRREIVFREETVLSSSGIPSYVTAVKLLNLRRYENLIQEAKNEGADIVVFPEDTTTGWPKGYNNGRDGALPWLEEIPSVGSCPYTMEEIEYSSPAMFYGSQYAHKYNITLVIDIGEVEWCNQTQNSQNCPSDGRWQFNTQIAFDSTGTIIGKHRKLHLFLADTEIFNYPEESLDTFTAFGVEFGMIVCFDIWFSYPGFALASQKNVENFVLSSWWENNGTLPLVTAANMQQAFARSSQSNLLACSVGLGFMNSGSGIYNGVTGEQNYYFDPTFLVRKDVLLVQELPKSPRSSSSTTRPAKKILVDSLSSLRASVESDSRTEYNFAKKSVNLISLPENANSMEFVPVPGETKSFTLKDGETMCEFNITVSAKQMNTNSTFVAMAYNGPYFDDLLIADLCAVYRCADHHLSRGNCQTLTIESDVSFDEILINANFVQDQHVYAIASQNEGQLLPASTVQVTRSGSLSTMYIADPSVSIVNAVFYAPSLTQNYY